MTAPNALVVAAKAPKSSPGHVRVESWGQAEIAPHGPAEIPASYTPGTVKDNNAARCHTALPLLSQLYFVAAIKLSDCNRYCKNITDFAMTGACLLN